MTAPIKAALIFVSVVFLWSGLGFLGVSPDIGFIRTGTGVVLISLASVLWLAALQ